MIEVTFRFKVSNGRMSEDKLVNIVMTDQIESLLTCGVNNKIEVLSQILDIKINNKTIKEWIDEETKGLNTYE